MKFGILTGVYAGGSARKTEAIRSISQIGDYVVAAERLGFHSIFFIEHHFIGNAQVASTVPLLAYLSGITSRIRLGTGVVVLSWHNPALLAEEIATIDQLSNGRIDIGIGRGYRTREFNVFGIPIEEAAARSEEAYAFLRRAWTTTDRFSHRGRFWQFDDIVIDPPVFQKPHPPMWLGASSIGSIRRAGAQDLNLLLDQVAPPELILERVAAFRAARIESGAPYDPMSVCVSRAFRITANEAERQRAWSLRADMLVDFRRSAGDEAALFQHMLPSFTDTRLTGEDASLIGEPSEIIDKIARLREGGVEYLMLADIGGSIRGLEEFMEKVAPHF